VRLAVFGFSECTAIINSMLLPPLLQRQQWQRQHVEHRMPRCRRFVYAQKPNYTFQAATINDDETSEDATLQCGL
jgi:uncharacterized lipoprotein YddW (UPF0748 family)